MRFSLIIVTKGRPAPLRAALESTAQTLPADGEVIVVDGDPERSAKGPYDELRARALNREWSGLRGLLEGISEVRRSGRAARRARAR